MADRIILSTYAPAAVVVDDKMQVHQFRGRTDLFLEHMPGPATFNLIQLARTNLVPDLRATIRRSIKTGKPTRTERAKVTLRGKNYEINIQVVPFKIPTGDKSWFLVIFDETTRRSKPERLLRPLGKAGVQREVTELHRELAASKESLQATIEEHEATNEELKASNEEVESSNEELQSTNEELETAKEELQSTNEELTTLNEELSNRNLEMMQLTNELNNLLASTQMPIVMVDNALTVRRATPAARGAFNILPTDIGRPLSELRPNIDVPDMEKILREVIETLGTRERRVTDKKGGSTRCGCGHIAQRITKSTAPLSRWWISTEKAKLTETEQVEKMALRANNKQRAQRARKLKAISARASKESHHTQTKLMTRTSRAPREIFDQWRDRTGQ